MQFLSDLLHLFYPEVCMACGNSLYKNEKCICSYCLYHLPETDFHQYLNNPVMKHFQGKIHIKAAGSLYYFNKGQKVQKLIHNLKYQNKPEIGHFLGNLYGNKLKHQEEFAEVDAITAVPLHPVKQRKRGYNQSDFFGKGLAEAMGKPFLPDMIERIINNSSQTKKSRYERWENINSSFICKKDYEYENILLADDVITTGATIEACANVIGANDIRKVSIATIACAY
jgi:ComF family protein